MHEKASSYVNNSETPDSAEEKINGDEKEKNKSNFNSRSIFSQLNNEKNSDEKSDDSSLMLLILLILLSQDGADDKMLLALLYLLF
ncbi:MAG: hypothetical protein LIO43_05350 [Clostridiales bacterium]|nr:hypothetical protein [Clostridiales bacterium]